ncbi:hypothetical protein ACP275_03G041900 [Erythranthe tilingii]
MEASILFNPSAMIPCISRTTFLHSRAGLMVRQKVFFSRATHDRSVSLRLVSPTLLAAEKEEAKAVLALFLKKQGLRNAVATKTINKSNAFIDHLVSLLHSVHKSRYLVGRELTTLEIRDVLIPYLETFEEEYGSLLVDVVENFSVKEKIDEKNESFEEKDVEKIQ